MKPLAESELRPGTLVTVLRGRRTIKASGSPFAGIHEGTMSIEEVNGGLRGLPLQVLHFEHPYVILRPADGRATTNSRVILDLRDVKVGRISAAYVKALNGELFSDSYRP